MKRNNSEITLLCLHNGTMYCGVPEGKFNSSAVAVIRIKQVNSVLCDGENYSVVWEREKK